MRLKILDTLMWIAFIVSLLFTLVTIIVVYGISYIPQFLTFLPLEIALAATFFLWGLNSHFNQYISHGKHGVYLSFILGGILLVFAVMGVY